MIKSFVYFIPMRLPTTNAHGVQIFKTLSAMTKFASKVKLVYGARRQTDDYLKGRDPFDFYAVDDEFSLQQIPYLDIVWLWEKLPSAIWSFMLRVANVMFAITCCFYMFAFEKRQESIAYTREWLVAALLAILGYRVGLEVHQVGTAEFSDRAISLMAKLSSKRPRLKIITISKNIKEKFIHKGTSSKSIIVSPDGAELQIATTREGRLKDLKKNKTDFRIGYTGQLHEGKGIDVLIKAAQIAPEYEFHILGGDHLSIKRWALRLENQNITNVTFHGYLPHGQVNNWRSGMDLLLLPQTSSAYQSPLKLFEYMASGIPFICSDLPVLKEIITDKQNCRVFRNGSHHDLVALIESMRMDYSGALDLAARALIDVQQFSWNGRAAKISETMG